MDTEKQRQCRHNDTRLTESRNARSEQLLVMPTVTNQQRMAARRALEWIERRRPSWFLDMKYQTCLILSRNVCFFSFLDVVTRTQQMLYLGDDSGLRTSQLLTIHGLTV